MKIVGSAQDLCHWSSVGDNSLVHELRVMGGSC